MGDERVKMGIGKLLIAIAVVLLTAVVTLVLGYGILYGIGIARSSADRPDCQNNLRMIKECLAMYADLYHDYLPVEDGAAGLNHLTQVISAREIFHCPNDKLRKPPAAGWEQNLVALALTEDTVSYEYRGGLVWQGGNACNTPVCWDKAGNHGAKGLNVLFCDGRVEFLPFQKWKEIPKTQ